MHFGETECERIPLLKRDHLGKQCKVDGEGNISRNEAGSNN